jgi:hypothetical protein
MVQRIGEDFYLKHVGRFCFVEYDSNGEKLLCYGILKDVLDQKLWLVSAGKKPMEALIHISSIINFRSEEVKHRE